METWLRKMSSCCISQGTNMSNNPIIEYYTKIVNGEILANDMIKKQYDILANAVEQPGRFHYSPEAANKHISFMEKFCKQSQGQMGAQIKFELFQRAAMSAIYGFVDDDGYRQYQECDWLMGRKNGKTTTCSCMSLDHLCNDNEGAPEGYFLATKKDQAKKGFDEAVRMMKHSPDLRRHLKKRTSDLYFPLNEGILKPLASDTNKMDSFNASYVCIDELGAIANRSLYDDMKQAMSAKVRRQPLMVCISTNNFIRGGIFDAQVEYGKGVLSGTIKDPRFLFLYYCLDKKDHWLNQKYWIMANPGLGTIKSVESLQGYVEKAKVDRQFKPTVMVKDFNMTENEHSAWLEYDEAFNDGLLDWDYLRGAYAIGGADLSATTDLTCGTFIIRRKNDDNLYVVQHYFIPETRVEEVEKQDKPEAPYRLWAEQGWLTICAGTQVQFHDVTMWFYSMCAQKEIRPLWTGYDRALAGYWVDEMESYGFTMEKIAQGPITWTYPFKMLKAEFKAHKVIYDKNPVTLWCLINTGVKSTNPQGIESQAPIKIQKNRRIDGTVSLLNAYTCMKNHEEEYLSLIH